MARESGWPGLFAAAFQQSKNAMVLLDEQRRVVDVNGSLVTLLGRPRAGLVGHAISEFVAGGPVASAAEWTDMLAHDRSTGEATLVCADGGTVSVQWGASTEVVTGRRLVLFVALSTARWGRNFRAPVEPAEGPASLSRRQREIVQFVALGHSGPEIADELQIAHETVRTHVRAAKERLGARSRAHLVARALAEGHI